MLNTKNNRQAMARGFVIIAIANFFILFSSSFLLAKNSEINWLELPSSEVNQTSSKTLKNQSPPRIQLANIYKKENHINLKEYLVSEKLDGVRGYWNGKNLITKQGNVINAPEWFIEGFPKTYLDGELWISRGTFDEVSAIIRQENPNYFDWRRVKFMIFDMPKNPAIFAKRYEQMKDLVKRTKIKHLQVIEQFEVSNHEELMKKLDKIVLQDGEGLMLHKKNSYYKAKRDNDLLKVKKYEDSEALVIGYKMGNGKYSNQMGSLIVKNLEDGMVFNIGSGFSDEERQNPPKIGSIITYKFYGKSKNGKPRFASFIRVRKYKF